MPENLSNMTMAQAIRSALDLCLERIPEVVLIGDGVSSPNGVFGTTVGLCGKYGVDRVVGMPLSENGIMGICIGAALSGLRPVLVHQRIEFSILAIEQLINNAARWNYEYGGQATVPLVVRMIIGTGVGVNPVDLQSLQHIYAQIPGLTVVMPATPYDAKGMLTSAIEYNKPVIFFEHRSLHDTEHSVPNDYYLVPLEKANVVREGTDITIAAFSYMSQVALKAADVLAERGIDVEVVDMRCARPLDTETVLKSLAKTGRLLVADTGYFANSLAAVLIANVMEKGFQHLKTAPIQFKVQDSSGLISSEALNQDVALADTAQKMIDESNSADPSSQSSDN